MPSRRRQKSSVPSCAWMSFSPLWPPVLPPSFSLAWPGSTSSSSCTTRISLGLDLEEARQRRHREARAVHEGHRLAAATPGRRAGWRAPPAPGSRARAPGARPAAPASASTHQKPALWRVASYSGPGLPRPTKSRIMERNDRWGRKRQRPHRGGACDGWSCRRGRPAAHGVTSCSASRSFLGLPLPFSAGHHHRRGALLPRSSAWSRPRSPGSACHA